MSNKLKIVFMGTPDFAVPCLDILVAEQYNIVAAITQPDRRKGRGQKVSYSPVKEAALKYGINVYQPERIRNNDFIDLLTNLRPEIIIVVAFGQLLPKSILDLPPLGCINVHASLLPEYRGAAPIHWAIINGCTKTGITTMYMDTGMDTGDMILKHDLDIAINDTTGQVHDKLKTLGASVLSETIKLIQAGTAPRSPQDHRLATYAPLLTRDIERVDWQKTAVDIHNLIRGLNPWPGAYCVHENKILKLWETRILNNEYIETPGRVIEITNKGIIVATARGLLELCEIQPESKRRMNGKDYAHGYGIKAGDYLE